MVKTLLKISGPRADFPKAPGMLGSGIIEAEIILILENEDKRQEFISLLSSPWGRAHL
jgi:hypothetical protein